MPPTEKPKPKPKKVKVVLQQPTTDDITVDAEGDMITLREELPQAKKRKDREERKMADGVADTLSQLRKQHEDSEPVTKKKREEEESEDEDMEAEEEKEEFKPHVYAPEAMHIFKGRLTTCEDSSNIFSQKKGIEHGIKLEVE